jgi:hypothetical protein
MAMIFFYALMLAHCSAQSSSPTRTPSCFAVPGFFCRGGSALICPIGAYCAGGTALNVSCYPVSACSVVGLRAQPACTWSATTVLGGLIAGSASGTLALPLSPVLDNPRSVFVLPNGTLLIADSGNNRLCAWNAPTLSVFPFTLPGARGIASNYNGSLLFVATTSGSGTYIKNGVASSQGSGLGPSIVFNDTRFFVARQTASAIYTFNTESLTTNLLAGSPSVHGYVDGNTSASLFNRPGGLAINKSALIVADSLNFCIRRIENSVVSTIAGCGSSSILDGASTSACFFYPFSMSFDRTGNLYVADQNVIRRINPYFLVITLAGVTTDLAARGLSFTSSGSIYLSDTHAVHIMSCLICPLGYYCEEASGNKPIFCPAGSFCPQGSFFPTPCTAGRFSSSVGASSCQLCPGGHYCPAGTSSWAHLNCGRGNYCPDGSAAPILCPYQVPPSGGWGAVQVQGPAFMVETATCLKQCFWNVTSKNSALSTC